MNKPMTAEEARDLIDVLNDYGQIDEEGIIVSVLRQAVHEAMEGLRAYADMLEREAEHFEQEHRKQQEAEERRHLENIEMEKHFRDHPHG